MKTTINGYTVQCDVCAKTLGIDEHDTTVFVSESDAEAVELLRECGWTVSDDNTTHVCEDCTADVNGK